MKKKLDFNAPDIQVVYLSMEDVLAESANPGEDNGGGIELPEIKL